MVECETPFSLINAAISQEVSSQRLEVSTIAIGRCSDIYLPLIEDKNTERMREAQLGSHTIQSHGVTLARTHIHDWLMLILLIAIMILLNMIHPFYRFVGKDMMSDLKYPLKSNTVPVWAVPMYAVLLPMVIFVVIYLRRRDVYDLHHAILGLLFSILVTGVITDAIKDAVGRPRPDFFWRCFPDGKDVYDQLGDVICHGDASIIREGHKSFPSGHTSCEQKILPYPLDYFVIGQQGFFKWKLSRGSFAGLGFLSLYLSGKIKVFDHRGHVAKLCIVFLPLLFASLVGISRVDDYWHHWTDVFSGGLIGLTVATFCYLQFFPPPYHSEGWGPYAYFRVLEESLGTARAQEAVNNLNAQPTGEHHQTEGSRNTVGGLHTARASGMSVEDLEAGRREF